jgi:Pyridoxamine 5'-phosphate oxidase
MQKDFEDLSRHMLDREDEEELLKAQSECTFIWSRKDGWPVGVTMTYIYRDGKFWMTTSGQHPRVLAVKRDDRCCVVVSSAGAGETPNLEGSRPTMLKGKAATIKGRARILTDPGSKAWFFREFAAAVFAGDRERRTALSE